MEIETEKGERKILGFSNTDYSFTILGFKRRKEKGKLLIFFVLFCFILLCERKNRWKKTEKRLKN